MVSGRLGIWVPTDLLSDARVKPLAKYLYLVVRARGRASISELSRVTGISRETVRLQCRDLAEAGWIAISAEPSRRTLVAAAPRSTQEALAQRLKENRWEAAHAGEFLMKSWLDLLVDSDNYVDNSRPSFLVSPVTGQLMEYDRYYREGVAFEYQGSQHYEMTSQFPEEPELQATQVRDHIKASLSQKNGITLVHIVEADLTLKTMQERIPDILPVRAVDEDGAYARMLTRLSDEYISNCRRLRSRERRNGGAQRP